MDQSTPSEDGYYNQNQNKTKEISQQDKYLDSNEYLIFHFKDSFDTHSFHTNENKIQRDVLLLKFR